VSEWSTCPCCGYPGLAAPARSAPCEICAWDERSSDGDRDTLAGAQRAFARTGASDPALVEFTRPPRPDETRPSWWVAIDDALRVLGAEIAAAFADVTLDGGVSMVEAELIDDYALPSRSERDPPPRGHGHGPPWQELTLAGLDRFPWGNFSFQDARGIRYYLPAFMLANLRRDSLGAHGSLLFTLRSGHQLDALVRLLTAAQRRAVARYLALVANDFARWKHWPDELDPAQRAMIVR
jgi:Cysteine-rich CPCC